MVIKKYNVIVTQRTEEEYVFSYDIIPSPVTELWEKVILASRENNLKLKHFSHIKCVSPQESLDKINEICESLPFGDVWWANLTGSANVVDRPKKIEDLTEDFLNELHQAFHRCFEVGLDDRMHSRLTTEEIKDSILKLNNLIHDLDNFKTSRNFNIIKVNYDMDPQYQQSITKDLYPYWDYTWGKIGDLRLGYATVGKRLHEAFITEDIEVVKAKLIRPQINILSEVYLIFTEKDHRKYKKEVEFPIFLKWCEDNNVSEYGYDPLEPQHRYTGRPLLGKLNKEITLDLVKDKICGYTNLRVEIE